MELVYGDFHQFYSPPNANVSLRFSGSFLEVTTVNKLSYPTVLRVNLYDTNRFIPGTNGGFIMLSPSGGQVAAPGSAHTVLLGGDQLRGVLFGDTLQASMIQQDGAVIETSNLATQGYSLPNAVSVEKLLSFFGVKYVVLRKDVVPNFGPFSPNGASPLGEIKTWNYSRAFTILLHSAGISLTYDWGTASLWTNAMYDPNLVYASTQVGMTDTLGPDISSSGFNALSSRVLADSFQVGKSIFLIKGASESEKSQSESFHNFTGNVVSSFSISSPTKIVVNIETSGPFFLVFGENFDPKWEAFIGDPGLLTAPFSQPIQPSNHFVANGFSNGWFVDKAGTYSITLYYVTQSIVFLGAIISFLVVLTLFAYSIRDHRQGFFTRESKRTLVNASLPTKIHA
jgi:hypothetical protein